MRQTKLTRQEKAIENALLKGEYRTLYKNKFEGIAEAVASRRKDAVLNIRVNSLDLENIRKKAEKLGIKYQTFLSELVHKVAKS